VNNPEHTERLLADVLGEGFSAGFRDDLLSATLRRARRRRQWRQGRRVASAFAVLAVLALASWRTVSPSPGPADLPAKPYLLVRTQPLAASALLITQPLSPSRLVASAPTAEIVVTAVAGMKVRNLSDEELLALAPQPAALVRFGPHSAELVFVSREDGEEKLQY
jgi:hypothetical protein